MLPVELVLRGIFFSASVMIPEEIFPVVESQLCEHSFYNICLISRALISTFLLSIKAQTDKILIYANFQVQL